MDSVTSSKVGALFALMALTLTFGVLPYFLVLRGARSLMSNRRYEQVIKYLNCFGGGVFLGALLLHLMVEGAEEFEEFQEEANFDNEYPFFNLAVAAGFFSVAIIEYVIHGFLLGSHDHMGNSNGRTPSGHAKNVVAPDISGKLMQTTSLGAAPGQYGSVTSCGPLVSSPGPDCRQNGHEIEGDLGASTGSKTEIIAAPQESASPVMDKGGETGQGAVRECESSCAMTYSYASTASPTRALLLLAAFSFHTIFDGLAVGLQESNSEMWQMFTAIAIHKCIVAFCLGIELFSKYSNTPKKAILWIGFFSLMSPVGICIGIYVTSDGVDLIARHLSSGILQGLAAGTFMYVTFLEILGYFWKRGHDRHFLDIFFALIGFGCMAGVKYLDKD